MFVAYAGSKVEALERALSLANLSGDSCNRLPRRALHGYLMSEMLKSI
ncbi:hypothetical protein KCP71_18915 [Salmonella enterica subsp. enterica]|nr:hypothetical protein KCP71_18915 [Salmonella enterica subsp. enterica]